MQIKIINSHTPALWYSRSIGGHFDTLVDEIPGDLTYIVFKNNKDGDKGRVFKTDCIEIKPMMSPGDELQLKSFDLFCQSHNKSHNKSYDFVNPSHYNGHYSMEVIDMMVAIYGKEKTAIYCEITAFKYSMRVGLKPGQPVEQDVKKRDWYLSKAKELRAQMVIPFPQ